MDVIVFAFIWERNDVCDFQTQIMIIIYFLVSFDANIKWKDFSFISCYINIHMYTMSYSYMQYNYSTTRKLFSPGRMASRPDLPLSQTSQTNVRLVYIMHDIYTKYNYTDIYHCKRS